MTDAGAPPGPPADDVRGLVRDGQAKFASGEVEQARTSFAKALKLKPDDVGAKVGLDRCERLLKERDRSPPPEPVDPPPWPGDGLRDDFPDSAENPEATIVDPNYLVGIAGGRTPDPGASGDFPEPLTVPRTPALDRGTAEPAKPDPAKPDGEGRPDGSSGPPASSVPAYPRYVSTLPGNYPDVQPGGRPVVPSPPPVAPGTPLPGPAPLPGAAPMPGPAPLVSVAYPQMPPGGPSAYPQYATPIGGYQPAPAPPAVWFSSPGQRRWMIICASVGAGCLLLGLLLGWAMFGASGEKSPAAGTSQPLVAGDAGSGKPTGARGDAGPAAPPAPSGSPKGLTPPPASGGAASARVTAIERPVLVMVTAPTAGEVVELHAKAAAQVKMGAPLYTIKGGKKARLPEAVVEAPKAGRFEVRAAKGDAVREGDLLGLVVDPDAWLLIGDLTGEGIAPAWRCEVASGDGISRSACRVDSVELLGGGRSRVSARVTARDAGWLKGDETDLTLTVSPR